MVQIEPRKKEKPRRVYDAPSKGVLWGWEVSAYIWTKAIAAGAFLIPILGGYFMEIPRMLKQIGAVVAFIFLAITGVLLIMDLGRPDRFLNVLFRPQWKSWLSRGAYIITAYGGILTLWLLASFLGFGNLSKIYRTARSNFRFAFGGLHRVSFRAGKRTRFLAVARCSGFICSFTR